MLTFLKKKEFFAFCTFLSLAFSSSLNAQDMNMDLLIEKSGGVLDEKLTTNFVPTNQYGKLFKMDNKEVVQIFNSWLGVEDYEFTMSDFYSVLDNRHRVLQLVNYSVDQKKNRYDIYVFLPHPNLDNLASFGLLPEYRQLDQRKNGLLQKERIIINNNYQATLFEFNDGHSEILIELPHNVRLYGKSKSKNVALLKKFFNKLSIDRLKEKLNG